MCETGWFTISIDMQSTVPPTAYLTLTEQAQRMNSLEEYMPSSMITR